MLLTHALRTSIKFLLVIALIVVGSCPSYAATAFVQKTTGDDASGSNTQFAMTAFGSSVTTANLILVCIRYGGTATPSAPTDSQSNTYTHLSTDHTVSGVGISSCWYGKNVTGGASFVVTMHTGVASTMRGIAIEFSGADTTNPIDANLTTTATFADYTTVATVTSQSATPANANVMLVSYTIWNADESSFVCGGAQTCVLGTFSGTGWTQIATDTRGVIGYHHETAASSYHGTMAWSTGSTTSGSIVMYGIVDASSSTNYPRNVADAGGSSELSARVFTAVKSPAEGSPSSEVASRLYGALRSLTDQSILGDLASRAFVGARSGSDSTVAGEVNTGIKVIVRGVTDAAPQQFDLAFNQYGAVRQPSEGGLFNDNALRTVTAARSVFDFGVPFDAGGGARVFIRSSIESIIKLESADRAFTGTRSVWESGFVGDVATRTFVGGRQSTESFFLSEFGFHGFNYTRAVAEVLFHTLGPGGFNAMAFEGVGPIGDVNNRAFIGTRTPAENLSLNDASTLQRNRVRFTTENTAPIDSGTRIWNNVRAASDLSIIAELNSRTFTGTRTTADIAATTDVIVRTAANTRNYADTFLLGEFNTAGTGATRSASDFNVAMVVERGSRSYGTARQPVEATTAVDTGTKLQALNRSGIDAGTKADIAIRIVTYSRTAEEDQFNIPDFAGRVFTRNAFVFEGMQAGEVVTRLAANVRSNYDANFGLADIGRGIRIIPPPPNPGPPPVPPQNQFVIPPMVWYFSLSGRATAPVAYADTFARADSTSLGPNWLLEQIQTGQQQIISNTLQVGGINMVGSAFAAFSVFNRTVSAGQYAQLEIKLVNIDQGSSTQYGPAVRMNTDASNHVGGYVLQLNPLCPLCQPNQVQVILSRVDYSTSDTVTIALFPQVTVKDHDVFRLEINDTAMLARHNGLVMTPTCAPTNMCNGSYAYDSTYATGKVGMGGMQVGQFSEDMQFYKWSGGAF